MTAAILLIAAFLFHTHGGLLPEITAPRYTTCPEMSMEEALKQNVAYMHVETRELLKYATVKVQPKAPASCRCRGSVRVEIKVEGERVACAIALNGHPLLQEAAVKAAMQWRFKENPRYDSVIGMLVFEFK